MIITDPTDNVALTPGWDRTPQDQIAELAQFPAALIGDARGRMGIMHSVIKLATPGLKLAGSILPIYTREGDNLAIHRALDEAHEGDVLVINANSDTNRACFGDILGELCVARGVVGVVIDGATRDIDELLVMGLPTFARGISPAGPFKNGPGIIGAPVACGNVVCNPGDIIIGDSDGVVVIPRHQLEATLESARAQEQAEVTMRSRIHQLAS